jgi:hypothetical protein
MARNKRPFCSTSTGPQVTSGDGVWIDVRHHSPPAPYEAVHGSFESVKHQYNASSRHATILTLPSSRLRENFSTVNLPQCAREPRVRLARDRVLPRPAPAP